MAVIHFCDDDSLPLCKSIRAGGWLWTVTPTAVTCESCSELLSRDQQSGREQGQEPAMERLASNGPSS